MQNVSHFEINRSSVAKRIGHLAQQNHLLLFNYEARVKLEPNTAWLEGASSAPRWEAGILAEPKYGAFRSDLRIGSFHAGQQAKWTAHELCHALLGFAWQEGASLYFHATAARLAELLPVAVFYYYDEIDSKRCGKHADISFPYVGFCAACEAAAKSGVTAKQSNAFFWEDEGKRFVQSEIDAVLRGLKTGDIIANPNHKLNLASDGLTYARAQARRLNSPEFKRYIEQFVPENTGCTHSLEEFIERIFALQSALLDGEPFAPYSATQETWIAQDLAWRLIETQAQCDGELVQEFDTLLEILEKEPTQKGIHQVVQTYEELAEEYYCPTPSDMLSVGYTLTETYGNSVEQLREGLRSALPLTLADAEDEIVPFAESDGADRRFLAIRFAAHLKDREHSAATKVSFEAALCHPPLVDIEFGVVSENRSVARLNPTLEYFELTAEELADFQIFEDDEIDEKNSVGIYAMAGGDINIICFSNEQLYFINSTNEKRLDESQGDAIFADLLELGIYF